MVERVQDVIRCKIQVYQKAILTNRQVLKINTNFKEVSKHTQKYGTPLKFSILVFYEYTEDNMKCNIQKDSYGVPCEHEMQYTKRQLWRSM